MSDIKYIDFCGPAGVYYDAYNDRMLILKDRDEREYYNRNTGKLSRRKFYDVIYEDDKIKNVGIVKTTSLVFLSPLAQDTGGADK